MRFGGSYRRLAFRVHSRALRWAGLAACLLTVGALAAPGVAQATGPTWVAGPTAEFSTFDCETFVTQDQLLGDPLAAETWLDYQGSNPEPTTGTAYYIGLLFTAGEETLTAQGGCAASEDASLQMALPPNTQFAITASTPVVCFASGAEFSDGCPSTYQTGTATGFYKFDPPSPSGAVWNVNDGTTLEVDVPVITSQPMTNAAGKACTSNTQGCALGLVRMWDGFGDPYTEYTTLGVSVASAPSTPVSISYPSPSTSNDTDSSITGTATVFNEADAGSAVAEIGDANSPDTCTAPTDVVDANSVPTTSGTTSVLISTDFTGLAASTWYCWRQTFTPSGSGEIDAAWQAFRTSPIEFTIPVDFSAITTTSGSFSATGAVSPLTDLPSDATATVAQLGLDSDNGGDVTTGSCTDTPNDIQDVNLTAIPSADATAGSFPISTTFTGLTPNTYYCWRQVVDFSTGGSNASVWKSFETLPPLFELLPAASVADSSTSAVAATSAAANATVDNEYAAGVADTELGTQVSGSCSSPAGVASAGEAPVTAAAASTPISASLSGLQASTGYCWAVVFTPAGGTPIDGSWVPFTTASASSSGNAGNGTTPALSGLSLSSILKGLGVQVSLTVGDGGSKVVVDLYGSSAQVASAAKTSKHPAKPKRVLIGTLTKTGVASGKLKLKVPLNAKGKRALSKHGHLAVTVVTTVTPPGGAAQSNTSTLTLHGH